MAVDIEGLLGAEGKKLLEHKCTTIPKETIHLPGADYVDRIYTLSDRPTPVLKNRILSLTSRTFSERDWQATSFRDFLALYPNLVRIDTTTRLPTAHLMRDLTDDTSEPITHAPAQARGQMKPDQRVRPDL